MSDQRLDDLEVSVFCESMAMMMQSGIQTDEAVALLLEENTSSGGALQKGLQVMKEQVDLGSGLDGAMKESGIFPGYTLKMVEAGASCGRLEDILFRLSDYYKEQKTISEKIRGAITYPAAMLALIIVVLLVMLVAVLPAFTDVYNSMTGSLAVSSYRYIHWAYGFCWVALVVMILLAAALIAGRLLWRSGRRESLERFLFQLPLCGELLENLGKYRFTSALGTFLASGELQDKAVEESIPMTGCRKVEDTLRRCMARMDEGHSIARAAYDEGLFEPVYGRMFLAGERSGNLESVLERMTKLLGERCDGLVDRIVGIVDPLLSGVLMVTIGLTLLSVMLPLVGMMNSVG